VRKATAATAGGRLAYHFVARLIPLWTRPDHLERIPIENREQESATTTGAIAPGR
jgi:hypothetical protein